MTNDPDDTNSGRVERWLAETVATCPWCGAEVTRVSPRGLDYQDRICCLHCLDESAEAPCPLCRAPISHREKRELLNGKLVHSKCAKQEKRR